MIQSSSIANKCTKNTLKTLTFSRIDCCWQAGPVYGPVRAWMRRKLCFNTPLLCETEKKGPSLLPTETGSRIPTRFKSIRSHYIAFSPNDTYREMTPVYRIQTMYFCHFHKKVPSILFRRGW